MGTLDDATALVAGATSGVSEATAHELAEQRANQELAPLSD